MSFRVVGTNHTSVTVSSLDRTPPFFQVVYCRDADGVTFEFIEVKT